MNSDFHGRDVESILGAVFETTDGEMVVADPTTEVVTAVITVMDGIDDPPVVRLLAAEGVLKRVVGDFLVASAAADLIADDRLSLRIGTGMPVTSLVVTDEAVVSVVTAGERAIGLGTHDEAFVASARERYTAAFETGDRFTFRTPPRSRIRETLRESLGSAVADDFDRTLAALDAVRGDDGLDALTLCLLVAASHRILLYDLSKWGEDADFASKALFSNRKLELEEAGLLDTEKVPVELGRPRQRLVLHDERLREADPAERVDIARDMLSAGLEAEA